MNIGTEVLLILVLIIANGIFALSEIAIVSARKARLQQLANEGDEGAKAALNLANAPEHFLSTVQVGITLVGVLAGAYGGATIAEQLAIPLKAVPYIGNYSDQISLGIVVLVITYLSLIIGELVPKRLALGNPEGVARFVAAPMMALSNIVYPAVRLLSGSTNFVLRAIGIKPIVESTVTEEEIKVLIEQGTQAGTFEAAEQSMVERVFQLGDRRVSSIMTPRTDIVWLGINESEADIRKQVMESPHSSFPVCADDMDSVIGVVHVKDLLSQHFCGTGIDLKACMRKPLFVLESLPALKVLEQFKAARIHIALVVDEYGTTLGLLTLNDILEAIVGEIPTSQEPSEQKIIKRADGSWIVDGMVTMEELGEAFESLDLPHAEERDYDTLGGFVIHQIGSVPVTGQKFSWQGWHFEIIDMDGNRVDKVLLMQEQPAPEPISPKPETET
jgi:putative hemolysin